MTKIGLKKSKIGSKNQSGIIELQDSSGIFNI